MTAAKFSGWIDATFEMTPLTGDRSGHMCDGEDLLDRAKNQAGELGAFVSV